MSSAILQSSSTLGTGRLSTFEERQDKAEDALVRKTLAGQAGKRKRHQDVYTVHDHEDDSSDGNDNEDVRPRKLGKHHSVDPAEDQPEDEIMVVEAPPNPPQKKEAASAVGSALHRNADGSIAAPKVRLKPEGNLVWFRLPNIYTSSI